MDIIEKLKKIQLLAESGVDGEKLAAQTLLNQLMVKHKISLLEIDADINSEIRQECVFKLSNVSEAKLFHQCLLKFFGKTRVFEDRKNKLTKFVQLTPIQYVLFLDFFQFHAKQFETEVAKMQQKTLFAYVNKHNLFAENCETYALNRESIESFHTVLKMLDDVSYTKRLTNGIEI